MYRAELFKDKVVLVTGGRSGIGFAIAKQYLKLGAKLMIASRKEKPLQKACEELSQFGSCEFHPCDIRDYDAVQSLADQIKTSFGKLDILINNAGGQFPSLAKNISPGGSADLLSVSLLLHFVKTEYL